TYQWRICDQNGGACHDIAGATGNEYTLKSGDKGNTIRVQVTGKNTDGTDTATSVPSGVIAAASATPAPSPAPSGNGCPKLAAGASAVAVSDVSAPARLQVDQMQANPSVITAGPKAFMVKFHVSDTCGSEVRAAAVRAAGAAAPATAMDVAPAVPGRGGVDNVADRLEVEPAGGDVGGDEGRDPTAP